MSIKNLAAASMVIKFLTAAALLSELESTAYKASAFLLLGSGVLEGVYLGRSCFFKSTPGQTQAAADVENPIMSI